VTTSTSIRASTRTSEEEGEPRQGPSDCWTE
jgi:hypothetical protein